MDEVTKAYAAGLIDGEGYIGISHQTSGRAKNSNYQLKVAISMTTKQSVEFMKTHFGGNYYIKPLVEKHKPLFMWAISGDNASQVLRLILPYLQVKKQQALLAIKFRDEWQSQKDRGRKRCRPEVIEAREIIYKQMRILNKKGG